MLIKRSLALAGALTVLPQMVFAAETGQCVDVSVPKQAIEAHNGKWIELTPEQWEFLRGIYAMNPLTPPGLPYGDKAALAKVEAHMDKQSSSQARSNLQRPSMAQDMQKGRRTEIAEINGLIADKAKEAGLAAPTHERIVEVVRRVERGQASPRPELLFDA